MREFFMALWRDEEGQDLAEYALLIGLIAIAAIAAVTFLGNAISDIFNDIGEKLESADIPAET